RAPPSPRLFHPFPTRRSSDLDLSGPRRSPPSRLLALLPFFELQVLELDVEQLRLQPHMPAGHRAILPGGGDGTVDPDADVLALADRKSTRLNSSHQIISYAVF